MTSILTRNKPLRLTLYAILFLLWLFVMILPCFAFALAARGELSWERSLNDQDRLWLIQEREQRGLGYQSVRLISDHSQTGGPTCIRTSVRYFLWEGSAAGENVDYCECSTAGGSAATACP